MASFPREFGERVSEDWILLEIVCQCCQNRIDDVVAKLGSAATAAAVIAAESSGLRTVSCSAIDGAEEKFAIACSVISELSPTTLWARQPH